MNSPEGDLRNMFQDKDRLDLGNQREVWQIDGQEGVDFIVKDKTSEDELQALLFLSDKGISEKLLMYDAKKLAFQKTKGVFIGDYLDDFVKAHPLLQEESSANEVPGSKFKIKGVVTRSIPLEAVLENGEIRDFYIKYVSKLLFQVLAGVFHQDIKTDNVFVEKGGESIIIDYGQAALVPTEIETKYTINAYIDIAINDVLDGLGLLQKLNPYFGEIVIPSLRDNKTTSFFSDMYSKYQQDKITLQERPRIIREFIEDPRFLDFIKKLNIPEELASDIKAKVSSYC
jgi:serine/threonine protein kinase